MSEMKYYDFMDIEAMDDEHLKKSESGRIELTQVYLKSEVDAAIAELKAKLESVQATAYAESVDAGMRERKLKRALWLARAAAAKFWANYWFDVAPSKYIKYDRIGRMEGVEKEFILTKVTKHMTASDWVGLWEKVEQRCKKKAEDYK